MRHDGYHFLRRYIDPQEILLQKSLKDIFALCFGSYSTEKLFIKYNAFFHPQLIRRFLREMNTIKNGRRVHYDVQKTTAVNYIKYAAKMYGDLHKSDRMTALKMIRESGWGSDFQNLVHKELFEKCHWHKDPRDVVIYEDECLHDLYTSQLDSLSLDE